ncbi:MAG: hypothetical protein NUV67_05955 [archaeon]|nr:hypothetical protein [archaeon]
MDRTEKIIVLVVALFVVFFAWAMWNQIDYMYSPPTNAEDYLRGLDFLVKNPGVPMVKTVTFYPGAIISAKSMASKVKGIKPGNICVTLPKEISPESFQEEDGKMIRYMEEENKEARVYMICNTWGSLPESIRIADSESLYGVSIDNCQLPSDYNGIYCLISLIKEIP